MSLQTGAITDEHSIRPHLSNRFRLRMDDSGIDEMINEQEESLDDERLPDKGVFAEDAIFEDEGVDVRSGKTPPSNDHASSDSIPEEQMLKTLDGGFVGDEFHQDTANYNFLIGKIDTLLEKLRLEA